MTIAMIMSPDRLEQEHTMLNRLVVGLLNDGRQVIRVVPSTPNDELTLHEKAVSLAKRLSVPMPVSWLQRSTRKDEVIEALEKANTTVIAAFGKQALKLAKEVAPNLDLPILFEVITMKDAKRAKPSSKIWRWFAATPSIARTISQRVGEDRTALVPLGTTTPKQTTTSQQVFDQEEATTNYCIAVLDAASDPKSTRSILLVLSKLPNIHIFLELHGRNQHRVWRMVHTLGMHDRVTCLRDMGKLRSLIVQTDLVILPAKSAPIRTVLLEAMRHGIPVVATEIDGFDMLVHEETALIAMDDWKDPLERMLRDEHLHQRIGDAGAALVASHYASAAQIAAFDAAFTM